MQNFIELYELLKPMDSFGTCMVKIIFCFCFVNAEFYRVV